MYKKVKLFGKLYSLSLFKQTYINLLEALLGTIFKLLKIYCLKVKILKDFHHKKKKTLLKVLHVSKYNFCKYKSFNIFLRF